MKADSLDLREKVVAAIDRGMPRATAAATFDVSRSTIKRWLRRRQVGTLAPVTAFSASSSEASRIYSPAFG